jgi:DNA-binding response OmpR family regulator
MKLLIIDSDRDLAEMLSIWLKSLGYQTGYAINWEQGKTKWIEQQPDLVIMDIALEEGVDGLEKLRELRSKHNALVMVITEGHNVRDEIQCLDSGADDYIRKPFFPAQIAARIRAVSRRNLSILQLPPSSTITVGPICVDSLHNEVTINGKSSSLTPTESKLLHLLAINANDVCTANQIVSYIWGFGNDGDTSLIKAHIRHLRQKVEPDPNKPRYILTISGVGYSLVRHHDEEMNPATKDAPSKQNFVNS